MKVIGYTRVSTEEQATSGVSLTVQTLKIQAYAELYDLEIVEIIEDGGQSAKSLNRPGIQRALQMMRDGEAKGLLVAKLDRLTRSVADMDSLITNYFGDKAKYQVSLLSVADQVDTRTAAGRLVLNVLMSVAQWEREAIGERTKAALEMLKAEGKKLGAPSLGETPEEIKTLNYIKTLRTQGMNLSEIADRLNTESIKTKRGGKWYAKTVSNYLNQEAA